MNFCSLHALGHLAAGGRHHPAAWLPKATRRSFIRPIAYMKILRTLGPGRRTCISCNVGPHAGYINGTQCCAERTLKSEARVAVCVMICLLESSGPVDRGHRNQVNFKSGGTASGLPAPMSRRCGWALGSTTSHCSHRAEHTSSLGCFISTTCP